MHIACTKRTIVLGVCVSQQKKACVNKDFTVTEVVQWQRCLPEISIMVGEGKGGRPVTD